MSDPSLALQKAVRARLAASYAVTALVPAASILDRGGRPETFPCLLIGEGNTLHADSFNSFAERAFLDLHIWTVEPGLVTAKTIAGAIRAALLDRPPTWFADGFTFHNLTVLASRFVRDPDGQHGHGVISVEAILQEMVAA